MRTIILAAGTQERWGDVTCKQLVPIDKEPLLSRTVKQCKKIFREQPVVATQNPLLEKLASHLGYTHYWPSVCRWTVETLYSSYTFEFRKDTVIILLGDVYYTDKTLRTIKKGKTLVYGDNYEIYALKLTDYAKTVEALSKAIDNAKEGGRGKLWEFYRAYINVPMMPHVEWLGAEYTFIDDETQDFDKHEEYLEWREKNENNN